MIDDKKLLIGIVGTSIITYNAIRYVVNLVGKSRSQLIPVGTVSALYVYPVKSCKGKKVFSMYCGETGPVAGEIQDRNFIVINGKDGRFYTGRQKPCMILIDCDVRDGVLTMTYGGKSVNVDMEEVRKRNDVRTARLFHDERSDGLDCGDPAAAFLSEILEEPDTRLLMYQKGLYSNRGCVIERNAWNGEIPLRTDKTPFADDAPFMINTQASLEELNTRLKEKVVIERFRPVILVDKCAAWDEDKWLSVHIGDVVLQCLKPCLRCVMTTIDPSNGIKNPAVEPLKTLREFRLAPEGPMRDDCKDNPIFGVDAGLIRSGHIHVGQTVYVRYKSAYLKQTPFYVS
ncbi:hypothetical protein Y032_0007g3287 [Ancylostoma ceylanicum]|uniref:MOSC domain-containing protein n=2 Tax=Ancylostoma ceylanicum TaxID=53326 RepID=A0A016VPA9_9BILA|nr:hypothetical protein Y032_0007g3287 [Ancylostoma ceylanicum]